jgi:hypothetical protein
MRVWQKKRFQIAVARRRPQAGLLHHSDRGCQYTSRVYRSCLLEVGAVVSMSRKGNCWDNAVMESFFGSRDARNVWATRSMLEKQRVSRLRSDKLRRWRSSSDKGDKLSNRKRFLFLGSIPLMAAMVFTFSPMHAEAAATYSVPCPPTQSPGSIDTWVQVIQFGLNAYYYYGLVYFPNYPLATDGNFGPKTTTAVHDYQTSVMKITNGGDVVGDRTWSSLGFCDGFIGPGPGFFRFGGSGGTHCPGGLSEGSNGTWVRALSALRHFMQAYLYSTFADLSTTFTTKLPPVQAGAGSASRSHPPKRVGWCIPHAN